MAAAVTDGLSGGVVHAKGVYNTGDGFAIPAVSENQERALLVLDVLKFDKGCYDICSYGLEGSTGTTQSKIRQELMGDAISEVTSGFIFDDSSVKSERAAMNEVCSQYVPLLELGLVDDVEGTLAELNSKCETAGGEKLKEEFISQFTAYLEGLEK